ncbi:MAG: EF-hand domain-containing protein [Comamonadaceae bacterium]|nr:MAG: EF-hand domain-containing protein [Comamonadaceae bacterium]
MSNGKTRRTLSFDTRSVMLFAALSMGGAALQAQTSSTSTPSSQSSPSVRLQSGPAGSAGGAAGGSGTGLRASPGRSGTQTAQSSVNAAFARADANQDNQLSPAEAASFPAIGNRFKELDGDHDGSLSLQEFQAGASS